MIYPKKNDHKFLSRSQIIENKNLRYSDVSNHFNKFNLVFDLKKFVDRSPLCRKLKEKSQRNSLKKINLIKNNKRGRMMNKIFKNKMDDNDEQDDSGSNIYKSVYFKQNKMSNFKNKSTSNKFSKIKSSKFKLKDNLRQRIANIKVDSLHSSMIILKQKNKSNSINKISKKNKSFKQKIISSKNKFRDSLKKFKINLGKNHKKKKSTFFRESSEAKYLSENTKGEELLNNILQNQMKMIEKQQLNCSSLSKKIKMSIKKKVTIIF